MKRVLRLDMDANAVPKRVLSSFFFFGYLFCFVNNYTERLRSTNRDYCSQAKNDLILKGITSQFSSYLNAIFSIVDENLLPMS